MNEPILTIGITTYERPGALARAVDSILSQEGVPAGQVEIIVVDDASPSDAAREQLATLRNHDSDSGFSIRVLQHEVGTGGPSTGRNEVIEAAHGDYVLFLDDDNSFAPDALGAVVAHLSSTSADWVSLRRHRKGKSFYRGPEVTHRGLTRTSALWTFLIGGAFRRESLVRSGIRFDEAVSYGEDNEFVLMVVTRTPLFDALSDRDFVIEGDPLAGELPHISHLRPGVGFVETVVGHVERLCAILASSDLAVTEQQAIGALIFNRSIGAYQLHRKIFALTDDAIVRTFLVRWADALREVLGGDAQIVELAKKKNLDSVMSSVLSGDVEGFRASVSGL